MRHAPGQRADGLQLRAMRLGAFVVREVAHDGEELRPLAQVQPAQAHLDHERCAVRTQVRPLEALRFAAQRARDVALCEFRRRFTAGLGDG